MLSIVLKVIVLAACSDSPNGPSTTEHVASNVDPTRASARALFEQVRTICGPEYPDAQAYFALVKWETPKQELWRQHIENIDLPKYRFGKACQDHFGKLPLIRGRSVCVWEVASFDWQREDTDRAVIECVNNHGTKWALHLVRFGEEWWISGYTFEFGSIGFDHPKFAEFALSLPGVGRYIDGVADRVRNGEFATLDEAERAREDAVSKYSNDHPRPTS
jgi:hypothetical protein